MNSMQRNLPIRAHPLIFGTVVFLASEMMFFAGLFAAYYDVRQNLSVWPPSQVHLDVVASSMGTALLGISSASMVLMMRFLRQRRIVEARMAVAATIALAITFLYIAIDGWMKNTFSISSSVYGSLFYTMTGFHALHVLAGIFLLFALLFGLKLPAFERDELAGAQAISYYWHFVFIVWVGIWGTIYWVR